MKDSINAAFIDSDIGDDTNDTLKSHAVLPVMQERSSSIRTILSTWPRYVFLGAALWMELQNLLIGQRAVCRLRLMLLQSTDVVDALILPQCCLNNR